MAASTPEQGAAPPPPPAPARAADPALDFTSDRFDAHAALSTEGVQPPVSGVEPLDNVTKCRWILPAELPESYANLEMRQGGQVGRLAGGLGRASAHIALPLAPTLPQRRRACCRAALALALSGACSLHGGCKQGGCW